MENHDVGNSLEDLSADAAQPQPLNDDKLVKQIAEIIKGYEPVGHLDGTPEMNVIPNGYDLNKDSRTEDGFYWEYEDMDECAAKIARLIAAHSPSTEAAVLDGQIQEATYILNGWGHYQNSNGTMVQESLPVRIDELKAQRAALESVTTDEGDV